MRVQLVSDIHLEKRPLKFIDIVDVSTGADVLVLAGDIGCPLLPEYSDFLRFCQKHFPNVIIISGNNEYRSCIPMSFTQVDEIIQTICDSISDINGNRVYFLNNGAHVSIGRVNFIGATLWSHIPSFLSKEHIAAIDQCLNGMMVSKDTAFSVYTMNSLSENHLKGIEAGINAGICQKLKNVVVTHHAPLLKTFEPMAKQYNKYSYHKIYMYGTDLTDSISGQYIHTWMYGHTHWNTINNINGTMCVCNQYGNYDIPCRGWSNSYIVEI